MEAEGSGIAIELRGGVIRADASLEIRTASPGLRLFTGCDPVGVRTGCSLVAKKGLRRPLTDTRNVAAFRLPALATTAGSVTPWPAANDCKVSPATISSTGFVSPSRSEIGGPAGWQSQLHPVVAMLKIFDPGR